jgi:hypothetical protein
LGDGGQRRLRAGHRLAPARARYRCHSIALVWGFAVVADSAQFSAVVTEVAPEHAMGTALTLQTALGFLLTSVTIALVPHLREAGGWPLAFGVLAIGPVLGTMAMRRLRATRLASVPGRAPLAA